MRIALLFIMTIVLMSPAFAGDDPGKCPPMSGGGTKRWPEYEFYSYQSGEHNKWSYDVPNPSTGITTLGGWHDQSIQALHLCMFGDVDFRVVITCNAPNFPTDFKTNPAKQLWTCPKFSTANQLTYLQNFKMEIVGPNRKQWVLEYECWSSFMGGNGSDISHGSSWGGKFCGDRKKDQWINKITLRFF